jgi:hypothetical protein
VTIRREKRREALRCFNLCGWLKRNRAADGRAANLEAESAALSPMLRRGKR